MLRLGLGAQSYALGGLCNGASFELGFSDKISVGGFFDYAISGTKIGDRQWKTQFFNIGIRGSYHLAGLLAVDSPKLDPYAGVSLGTRSSLQRHQVEERGYFIPSPKGIFPGIHFGSFYHFSEKIGGFAEMGWGIAAVRLGISGKF